MHSIADFVLVGVPRRQTTYHSPLPEELAPFYCYPLDAGHSILAVPAGLGLENIEHLEHWTEYLVPVPVKTILRLGWTWQRDVPVVDLPYDPELGLVVDPIDEEW